MALLTISFPKRQTECLDTLEVYAWCEPKCSTHLNYMESYHGRCALFQYHTSNYQGCSNPFYHTLVMNEGESVSRPWFYSNLAMSHRGYSPTTTYAVCHDVLTTIAYHYAQQCAYPCRCNYH